MLFAASSSNGTSVTTEHRSLCSTHRTHLRPILLDSRKGYGNDSPMGDKHLQCGIKWPADNLGQTYQRHAVRPFIRFAEMHPLLT
jgi:hypothetical protein